MQAVYVKRWARESRPRWKRNGRDDDSPLPRLCETDKRQVLPRSPCKAEPSESGTTLARLDSGRRTRRMNRACIGCGLVIDKGTRCNDCRPRRPPGPSATQRGYGSHWEALSKQARKLQPWCSDCGSPDNLTVDHSPQSWKKLDAGKRLSLNDFRNGLLTVRCIKCNIASGSARGPNVSRPATNETPAAR